MKSPAVPAALLFAIVAMGASLLMFSTPACADVSAAPAAGVKEKSAPPVPNDKSLNAIVIQQLLSATTAGVSDPYIPCTPFESVSYTDYTVRDNEFESKQVLWPKAAAAIPATANAAAVEAVTANHANAAILALLPNYQVSISVKNLSANASFSYSPVAANLSKGDYKIVFDYCNYRVEPMMDGDMSATHLCKVGVGARVTATIHTRSAGLNLGGLMGIGLSANASDVQGSLYVESIGIHSKDVAMVFPFSTNIDQSGISQVITSLAIVKSKVEDAAIDGNVTLDPQVLAILPTPDEQAKLFPPAASSSSAKQAAPIGGVQPGRR